MKTDKKEEFFKTLKEVMETSGLNFDGNLTELSFIAQKGIGSFQDELWATTGEDGLARDEESLMVFLMYAFGAVVNSMSKVSDVNMLEVIFGSDEPAVASAEETKEEPAPESTPESTPEPKQEDVPAEPTPEHAPTEAVQYENPLDDKKEETAKEKAEPVESKDAQLDPPDEVAVKLKSVFGATKYKTVDYDGFMKGMEDGKLLSAIGFDAATKEITNSGLANFVPNQMNGSGVNVRGYEDEQSLYTDRYFVKVMDGAALTKIKNRDKVNAMFGKTTITVEELIKTSEKVILYKEETPIAAFLLYFKNKG